MRLFTAISALKEGHRAVLLIILGGFFVCGPWLVRSFERMEEENLEPHVRAFEKGLHKQEQALEEGLRRLTRSFGGLHDPGNIPFYGKKGFSVVPSDKKGILSYTVHYRDSLVMWTNDRVPGIEREGLEKEGPELRKLPNGWYEIRERLVGPFTIRGALLLKKVFAVQNEYLRNGFPEPYSLPDHFRARIDEPKGKGYKVTTNSGEHLLDLRPRSFEEEGVSSLGLALSALFVLLGMGTLFLGLFKGGQNLLNKPGSKWGGLLIPFLLPLIRGLTIGGNYPPLWQDTELFDPALYGASDLFPDLGNFLLNSLLLFFSAWFFMHQLRKYLKVKKIGFTAGERPLPLAVLGMTLLGIFAYGAYISVLVKGLVLNSNIHFDPNMLFRLSIYTLVGTVGTAALFGSFSFLANGIMQAVGGIGRKNIRSVGTVMIVVIVVYVFFCHVFGLVDLALVLWPVLVTLVIGAGYGVAPQRPYKFGVVVSLIAIFAAFTAHTISKFSIRKEHQDRLVLAEKLASGEDPVTDFRFDDTEQRILEDPALKEPFKKGWEPSDDLVQEHFEKPYFGGFWDKYNISYYAFRRDSSPVSIGARVRPKSFGQLLKRIQSEGEATSLSDHLYYIPHAPGGVRYIAHLPFKEKGGDTLLGHYFLEFSERQVPVEVGFPGLLMEEGASGPTGLEGYSYARYADDTLVDRSGEFPYRLDASFYKDFDGNYRFFEKKGSEHLVYKVEAGILLILSKAAGSFMDKATAFSYLFVFFSLLLSAGVLLRRLFVANKDHHGLSFKGKVQTMLVCIVLVSMILFGAATQYYIQEQYSQRNHDEITEKTHSVLVELEQKLGSEARLDPDLEKYTDYLLGKLSNVFFTDINLYDKGGQLFSSSRAQLFQKGLVAGRMNPKAFREVGIKSRTEFVQKERIGRLSFLSSYVPFRNEKGRVLGYLNLPYFAKQGQLEKELSTFFVGVINVFVLLFALSILAALFISNWVTRPLRFLQDRLARIELGGSNERLEYKRNDEIGELVAVYNEKVEELREKADQLARTERESAWREVAQQVAHEIKNPLTPMKLRLQQLEQNSLKRQQDPEKIRELTGELIAQIDTLSRIADAFSNFAKMPRPRLEWSDLAEVLNAAVQFQGEGSSVDIGFHSDVEGKAEILMDREQLSRVFNNLIQNAIEAIPADRKGKVSVTLREEAEHYLVEVSDNGKGIPAEVGNRIFEPRFTTRSTGTGIGLAMVKTIIEHLAGKVWFESTPEEGTSFFVRLKK